MNPHAKNWRHGDGVSTGSGNHVSTGKVVILRRHSDNQPFPMVQVTSGGRLGSRQWPDGWVLGTGTLEQRCRDCGQGYRTDDGTEIFCQACNRVDPRIAQEAESSTAARLRLRGNATRTEPRTVQPSAPSVTDDVETPF